LVLRGIALNAVLAVAKFTGGVLGSTYALIADGVESLLDIATSTLVWAGFKWAARPPDADHPYGHGKAEAVAAFAVALVILGAAVWIGRNAVHEIITPHRGPHWATLPLLAAIVIVKTYFSRTDVGRGAQHGEHGPGSGGVASLFGCGDLGRRFCRHRRGGRRWRWATRARTTGVRCWPAE
jgi:cation diffusion facilitator family transporter